MIDIAADVGKYATKATSCRFRRVIVNGTGWKYVLRTGVGAE
jgi:hypothetical protein